MAVELSDARELHLLDVLEKEIIVGNLTEEVVSPFIISKHLPFYSLNQSQRECIQIIGEYRRILLHLAAKHGKTLLIEFLIDCGIDVNTLDGNGETAIEAAFRYQKAETMWALLEAGSNFPRMFIPGASLTVRDQYAHQIDAVAERNNELHKHIARGRLDVIQNLGLHQESKYLSTVNQSALFTALDCNQLEIYAYLKSTGAQFRDKLEKLEAFKNLDENAKRMLESEMVKYFPQVDKAHIYYLISKSRSQKPVSNLHEKLKRYYEKLDEIEIISCILKVVQYAEYLDIIFDFDEDEISDLCPTFAKRESVVGLTKYLEGRIYIAAGCPEDKILGTLAHELTHLAMHMVFQNCGNPYPSSVSEERRLHYHRYADQLKKSGWVHNDASKIFFYSTNYCENEYAAEFVARVSQILAEIENGRDWLESHPVSKIVLNFYETDLLNECYEFIHNYFFTMEKKHSNILQNQTIAELQRLQSFHVHCKNVDAIKSLLGENYKRIFIYKVESTLLGLFKVLQGALGTNYLKSSDNYLLLRLECFLYLPEDFTKKIYSERDATVIFEGANNLDREQVIKICKFIATLPNKILFVVNETIAENLKLGLRKVKLDRVTEERSDDELTLFHLDEKTQNIILQKKINFQGRETSLKNFIGKDMYKKIHPEFIENLLKGIKVEIGAKLYGMSSMEGAYGDVLLDVNFDSFKNTLQASSILFVIENKYDEKYENSKMIQYFKNYAEEDSIYIYKNKKFQNPKCRIVLAERFSDTDFQTFCHDNEKKTIYWIKIQDLDTNSFRLQKFYDPEFYIKRKIQRVVKVNLDAGKTQEMIVKNQNNTFIIIGEESAENSAKEQTNAKYLDKENAEVEFRKLMKQNNPVHLLQKVDDQLVWEKSAKSIRTLRPYILKGSILTRLVEETDLIIDIAHEKVLLIADYPGMGKSTTLTRLYTAESIAAHNWIIRINLRIHWKVINQEIKSQSKITKETVIRFLREIEPDSKSKLNSIFLESLFYKTGDITKFLLIAFDGFDEILDKEAPTNIIRLLKFLKYETPCKFWITTRLHYKELLENELSSFALELEPFDDEARKNFIKKYFSGRLNLILNPKSYSEIFGEREKAPQDSKISIYTDKLLERMKDIFLEDVTKFIGTPLQLNLVLSGSAPHFKAWVEKNDPVPNFRHLGKNLLEVYQMFIERKYGIYFTRIDRLEKVLQKFDKVLIEEFHENLANSLILKDQNLKPFKTDYKEAVLSLGIVQSQDNENYELIHFTFREYYCSQTFIKYLNRRLKDENNSCDPKLEAILFDEILEKKEYELIRWFINIGLGEFPRSKIAQNVCKQFAGVLQIKRNLFHAVAKEGCQNIFSILYFSYKWLESPKKILRFKDNDGNYLVYSIIKGRNRLMLNILFQEIEKLPHAEQKRIIFNEYQKWHGSILHVAQMFTTFQLFKLIWEGINRILVLDKQKAIFFVTDCVKRTILHQACLARNRSILFYILDKAKELLSRGELKNFLLLKDANAKNVLDFLPMALDESEMRSVQEEFSFVTFRSPD